MFIIHQQTIDYYSDKWQLTKLKFLSSSPTSYLLEAYQISSGSKVALKFGHSKAEIKSEAEALKFYDGVGCVRLLGLDGKNGVLLRSYANPPSLKSFFPNKDEEAVLCAASVMKKLHSKKPKNYIHSTIADWLSSLKTHGVIPKRHIDRAKLLAKDLLDYGE